MIDMPMPLVQTSTPRSASPGGHAPGNFPRIIGIIHRLPPVGAEVADLHALGAQITDENIFELHAAVVAAE